MKLLPLVFLFCLPLFLLVQEGNVSAGGEYSGLRGTISNSTGLTNFITLTSYDIVNIQFVLQQVFFKESSVPTDNLVQNIENGSDTCEYFNTTKTNITANDECSYRSGRSMYSFITEVVNCLTIRRLYCLRSRGL